MMLTFALTPRDIPSRERPALIEARGDDKITTRVCNVASNDDKRLLDRLRKHDYLPPYRDFR
jgi:hypothetical protein